MSKQKVIDEFVNQNVGSTFKTSQICELCNVTLPTVLTYIKQNPSRFTKVKRGIYTINTTLANIIQSIADNQPLQDSTNLKTFDWDEL
jgi:hypothetical protein